MASTYQRPRRYPSPDRDGIFGVVGGRYAKQINSTDKDQDGILHRTEMVSLEVRRQQC